MVASIIKDGYGSRLCTRSHMTVAHELVEAPEDLDPVPELLQVQLFIRRMQAVVRQSDASENDRCPGRSQGRHDGDRSAGASRHGRTPRDRLEGLAQQLERRV